MKDYLFYLEGLGREAWHRGIDEKSARKSLWESLTSEDRDKLIQMDCLVNPREVN